MPNDLYFRYPILDLSYWQRFSKRVGRNILEIILLASASVLVISDVPNLVLIGFVVFIYLVYGLIKRATRSTPSTKFKGGNLAGFITKGSKKAILSAYDRSVFVGGNFLLHLTRELVEDSMVMRVLKGLDISRDEFVSKLESYINDEMGVKETNIWRQAKAEEVVIGALVSQPDEKRPIQPIHLF